MSNRILSFAYAYTVCLSCLALFAYSLLTLAPSTRRLQADLQPTVVSIFDTDATSTTGTAPPSSEGEALAAFDCAAAPERIRAELQSLDVSRKSFETARAHLDAERLALADASLRLRLIQRGMIMLFGAIVFAFHWRWVHRLNPPAA